MDRADAFSSQRRKILITLFHW